MPRTCARTRGSWRAEVLHEAMGAPIDVEVFQLVAAHFGAGQEAVARFADRRRTLDPRTARLFQHSSSLVASLSAQ